MKNSNKKVWEPNSIIYNFGDEPKCAFLMLKTKSISKKKTDIINDTENKLKEKFQIVERINIQKWAKGHTAYYME